ncbi:MAG: hypothetical protein O2780_11170 [Proteobacteria bacterium]|nr:hypothetical protein [Pseudomonadota bacterium]
MTALSVPVLACVSRAGKFPGLHATGQYVHDSLERTRTGTRKSCKQVPRTDATEQYFDDSLERAGTGTP